MKRVIEFGKIDFYGTGRRINAVTVEMELRGTEERPVFSCCANVWNAKRTDIVMGRQCLDSILFYLKGNRKFREIHDLWKKHHLNDMHAGTERQEACLKANHERRDYITDKAWLEKWGLLWDEDYKYGTAWLYRPIPKVDLDRIKEIMEE